MVLLRIVESIFGLAKLWLGMSIVLVFASASTISAQVGDWGVRDTFYVHQPEITGASCSGILQQTHALYIWSDDFYNLVSFDFTWSENIEFVDLALVNQWGIPTTYSLEVDTVARFGELRLYNVETGFSPDAGILAEVTTLASIGDSDSVSIAIHDFYLWQATFNAWRPFFVDTMSISVVPDSVFGAGDANCDLSISISDAVRIIFYIFAGEEEINDLLYVDVNADCAVTISDAVYLIDYIFGGGPDPQLGCSQ